MPDGSVGGALPGPIGPYRVEGVLGQGAMSVVYRATDGRTGQPVALKLLRGELLAAAERNAVLARFRREAEIGLKLDHRNIVRVHDYGMLDAAHGGAPYLAMELIQGRELKQYLEADTPLSVQQGGELMAAVLDALAFAHARNIIHRDIKPANIVVEADLTPKLADFGIAQISSSDLTQAGDLLGTPAYMAPEVLRGEKADARSDLFSAGVVLYYLLAQRRPFSGSVATVMQQILFVEPPPPSHGNPELPPPFDTMILKALAKAPADRYASAAEFAQALRHALAVAGTMRTAMPSAELTMFNAELPAAAAPARDRGALAAALETALRAIPGQPIDARKLTGLIDILAEWQAGTGGDAQRWQSVLLDAGIEPLTELIVAATPAPRAAPASQRRDWMPLVRLFAAMNRALAGTPAADRAKMSAARIAFDLSGRFFLYSGELNRVLMDGDNPDIQMLSLDFLRLEILQHALEELGAEAELAQSRSAMLMFAVQVIRKVTQILRACTDGNDGLARFGVAIILANIEELIVMAQRLFETGGQATGGLPQDAVAEFIAAAGRFATLSVEELRGEVATGAGTPDSFSARLRGVGQLYLFATRLTAPDCAPLMHSLSTLLYGLVAGLTADLGNAPVGDTGARTRLVALAEMASGLGWSEVERIALTALRRWAVAGAAA
ncbi:serine/threonine-protein kinase [Azospirillum lipoferum]|uniref:non-specific serine/threonine protein kinase n=1 Tax=Azospirillum lipoferum (strain 4B) TaxID=862719 RepID=G7Z5V6_AZOL4|nr:serine/threonine-protein kinase [Azospirillum lipoferum]CBS86332.1 putative serine/threonine protein kinase; type VI secretion associated protein [Azospirillum lipoferum 4B]